ncbi:11002_t:CDS:2, partial [Rhizophagus irregularis]
TDIERDCEKDFAEWVRTGKIIYKVNIYVGIENIAKGFVNMLSGPHPSDSTILTVRLSYWENSEKRKEET